MNTQDEITNTDGITEAWQTLDIIFSSIKEKISEAMLDEHCEGRPITREKVVAQVIMDEVFANPCDPEFHGDITALTSENKVRLVKMASHMGPDYAQALYHAAVFITKVA